MTATPRKFVVDLGWQVLLRDLGLVPQDLLRHARLPLDLFSRPTPALATEDYFRLWESLGQLLHDPVFPLRLGQAVTVEAFSPPIFACFCSPDLNAALMRLSQYKPLIGPLTLAVDIGDRATVVALGGLPKDSPPPGLFIATELVFLVHMARLATRERIVPEAVHMRELPPEAGAYAAFFGVPITLADFDGLTFDAVRARLPFMTASDTMWSVFEPELNARLAELGLDAGFRDRVRAAIMETLAGGQCTMADTARRLGVSSRTLQRRLREEGTTFQAELNALREDLARHYLARSRYSSAEISFLLGYDDPNSFIRAFHAWTGTTPERARAAAHPVGARTAEV